LGLVAALGPAVSAVPLGGLRLFVGGVLLIFGLQWLRKAVLRASGHKALHDGDAVFREQLTAAQSASTGRYGPVRDWYGFTVEFKSVVLEGLEVVFIALTFGANAHDVPVAAVAALIAIVVVAGVGIVVIARLKGFARFCYDFLVGDDGTVAVGVVSALAATYALCVAGVNAWWVTPAAVLVLLAASVRRKVRSRR
jgi:uncharacterized membrane protein